MYKVQNKKLYLNSSLISRGQMMMKKYGISFHGENTGPRNRHVSLPGEKHGSIHKTKINIELTELYKDSPIGDCARFTLIYLFIYKYFNNDAGLRLTT